jgi:uncharacterized protein
MGSQAKARRTVGIGPGRSAQAATRADVLERLREGASQIRALGVRSLSLFGSFVRDEAVATSDVDLLVEFEPGAKSYERLLDLGDLLEGILGRRVELVTPEGLSAYIGPHIRAEAREVPLGP